MKRFGITFLLASVCILSAFGDTEVAPYGFSLPGNWNVIYKGNAGFGDSPTEKYGISPFSKIIRSDGKYFGYVFSYGPGAMTGTGSPMMGDFEIFPEWEEFGFEHDVEAGLRSLLEKFGSDPRRQFFWESAGGPYFGSFNSTGYAYFNKNKYGFAAITIIPDVAALLTVFIFCDAAELDENINDMKEMLGIETIEYEEW